MNFTLRISDYTVMATYLIALVVIGLFTSGGKSKNTKDYLLGGGKMPVIALGISCLMAALSAFSLVMVPGEIYNHGLSYFILSLIYPLLTIGACAIFMRFYFKIGAFTPFEYLERRYSPTVRTLIASLTLYLRLIYVGMVLFSTSKIFEGAAGWPCWITILFCGLISMVFTSTGGFKAVVYTDVMQFIVLIGGLFCILGALFYYVDGGLCGGIAYAFKNGRGLDQFAQPDFYRISPYVRLNLWMLLAGQILAPVTTMASDQMTVQRLLASGNLKNAVRTQCVNTFLTIPTILILWVIGLLTFAFFHQNPQLATQVKSGDTALFQFIAMKLPSPLPGLVIAGMLAAVISTLNAVYNSMAGVYVKELHSRCFNKNLQEKQQVLLTKWATFGFGIISCSLGLAIAYAAKWLSQSVVEAQTIFSIFDAIVLPAFIYAILSRKASVLLAWFVAGILWGMKIILIIWYSVSTSATNAWNEACKAAPSTPVTEIPFNWGGGILPWRYGIYLLSAGLILLALWKIFRPRLKKADMPLVVLWSTLLGGSCGLLLWSAVSSHYCQITPHAVSFQWIGFPIIVAWILIGVLWLTLGKKQDPYKYQGLTLFDKGEVLKKDN